MDFFINMLFYTYILTLNHPKWYKSVKSGHNQAKTDPALALSDILDETNLVSKYSILSRAQVTNSPAKSSHLETINPVFHP